MRRALLVILSVLLVVRALVSAQPVPASTSSSCETGRESPLALPSGVVPERLEDYE